MTVLEFISIVQKEVCKIKKSQENEYTKSKYANLEDVLNLLNPYFTAHGACLLQFPLERDGKWILTTEIVMQDSGDTRTWSFPLLGLDSKNPMQAMGSATTYARRYQLKGIFKLVDSDDDANTITPKGEPSKVARKTEIDKMLRAFAALHITREEIEKFCQTDAEKITLEDMENLKTVYKTLKEGKQQKGDFFRKGDESWQE